MRAIAVREFGGSPELMDLEAPTPETGEVGIRLLAAGINPFDWKIIDGVLKARRPHRFPLILGVDGAGVVDAVGPASRRFRVGDRICGQFLHDPVGTGTYAERTTVPESIGVAPIPSGMDPTSAAALPTAGMTALHALDTLNVPQGGTLLVVGASGGIGSFVTRLASARGLRVTAVARSGSGPRLRSMGAAEVLDYDPDHLLDRARGLHPSGVDGLLDVMSNATEFARLAQLVRVGGVAASTTFVAAPESPTPEGVTKVNLDLRPSAELMERLMTEVRSRHLAIPVERRIRLEEAPEAVAESRAGRAQGKTVIVLGSA
jgi:NADPH:quinone reductase